LWCRLAAVVVEVVLATLLPAAWVVVVVVLAGVCENAITLANATVSARAMNFFMLLISLRRQIEVGATQV
jgi:hypothetical protein